MARAVAARRSCAACALVVMRTGSGLGANLEAGWKEVCYFVVCGHNICLAQNKNCRGVDLHASVSFRCRISCGFGYVFISIFADLISFNRHRLANLRRYYRTA